MSPTTSRTVGQQPDATPTYLARPAPAVIIEAIGQAMVWRAPHELVALSGAFVTDWGARWFSPRSASKRSSACCLPIAVVRWVASLPSWTSPMDLLVRGRAWLPVSSAMPPFICLVPLVCWSAQPL